jgi:cytochrome c oxidase cbb3-type subunit 3
MAKKKDELFDHEFDGIQEFDNDLPGWWVWLFIISTIFGIIYFAHYHVFGFGDSSRVQYLKQVNPDYRPLPSDQNASLLSNIFPSYNSPFYSGDYEVMQQDLRGYGATISTDLASAQAEEVDLSVIALTDATALDGGKQIFGQFCYTCHGMQGEGGIGPNLTDDYWIHGGSFPEVVHVIKKGVVVKGMIAWETQLNQDQIIEVASYVNTMRGTNPPNQKDPQGELYVAE